MTHPVTTPRPTSTELPPAPAGVATLRQIAAGQADPHEILVQAARDPAVVTALLRTAAWRGGAAELPQAMRHLGEPAVRRIVAHQPLAGLLTTDLPNHGLSGADLWLRSVSTAHAAEALAERLSLDPWRMYLAGLLLDVGKVVADAPALEFDYARVGADMVAAWGLAQPIVACIRFHHRPSCAEEFEREVVCAHLARFCADWLGEPLGLDAMQYPLDERVVAPLGLSEHHVDNIAVAVRNGLNTEP